MVLLITAKSFPLIKIKIRNTMKHSRIMLVLLFVMFIVINSAFGGNETEREKQMKFGGASSKTETESQENKKEKMPGDGLLKCPVCLEEFDETNFAQLSTCAHRCCFDCFQLYLCIKICESRVNITCPECSEAMHPSDIKSLLDNPAIYDKYEYFMVRRVLAADPDSRFCPAPDCSYAVIAADCAKCPKIKCEWPGCDSYFCYHCKAIWNTNHSCDPARAESLTNIRTASTSDSLDLSPREDIKPCPRCQVLIIKDVGCNRMRCYVCFAAFCWLCLKEVGYEHFDGPFDCTISGKKPVSRKEILLKEIFLRELRSLNDPVNCLLFFCVVVPLILIIGVPVGTTYLTHKLFRNLMRLKRNRANGGVLSTIKKLPVDGFLECPLCLRTYEETQFAKLSSCAHRFCFYCFREFLRIEICKSRVNIKCPLCSEAMHQSDIQSICITNPILYKKYEYLRDQRKDRQDKTAGDKNAKGKMKAAIVEADIGDDSIEDSGDDSEAESSSLLKKAV